MKYTFVITITFACLCAFTNGQIGGPFVTPYAGGGAGAGNGIGGGTSGIDYGFPPKQTSQSGGFYNNNIDNSIEDSTTMNPNGNGANAHKSISGGGQFALGFVAVLLVVGCAVILVFLVRRKRAQVMKDQLAPATSA